MQKHEQGAGCIETVSDLQNVLLARGVPEKLQAISRLDCFVCGTCEATRRKPRSRNAAVEADRRAFCQQCFMAEHMLEHEYLLDPKSWEQGGLVSCSVLCKFVQATLAL